MMEFLTDILDNTSIPWITAILLGFLTAISPCPLAANITAIGFISKDVEDRKRVFLNGIFYTTGRIITYTGLAAIIVLGADKLDFSGFFQRYGEKFIGPLLLIIGLFMLGLFRIHLPVFSKITEKMGNRKKWNYSDAVLLGVVLALAFCPYSGVLYFGMLIPLSVTSASGLYLPVIFAITTALPVIIIAWLIAYTMNRLGSFYNNIRSFELWFRRVAAILFMLIGIYYTLRIFL